MDLFYDIFKVVVVVIDGSDYLHGDDIPQLSHFSHLLSSYGQCLLNPDSFTASSVLNTSKMLRVGFVLSTTQ